MASHVTVIDSSARRAVIKTTPATYLSDVLEQACTKLGLNPSQYGLKNNNKQVDLSRTIRLSGLSSGAKLELILLSRSASVVSVALQLPESEPGELSNKRFTDKFPSTTTLWHILRQVESGGADLNGPKLNITARGVPKTSEENTNAGRLYYEGPVLQVMGREFSSLMDLQKTLGQLGFNSGSTLIRLSFRVSEIPLEKAMERIGEYFKEDVLPNTASSKDTEKYKSSTDNLPPSILEDLQNLQSAQEPTKITTAESPSLLELDESATSQQSETNSTFPIPATSNTPSTISGPNQRTISVFAPPSSTIPQAARQAHNEADYEPTIDHAKIHQSRLSTYSRNKRLPTDAEVAAQQEAEAQKLAEVKTVEIKVRLPDQSQVISTFTTEDTAETLYGFVRGMLTREGEPFLLNYSSPKGPQTVPRDSKDALIKKLGMRGRVLVNLLWDEGASADARSGNVLKDAFRQQARVIEVKEVEGVDVKGSVGEESVKGKEKEKEGGGKGKGGMPKWLKLPGKK